MFEKKITKTTKIVVKDLTLENGKILDADGIERDLNKIVIAAFENGDEFTFQVVNKSDDSEILSEEGESDAE